jgi:hypothetical protein
VPKLAVIRFRVYLAFYESEFVRSLLHISQRGKNLIWVAMTNPRRIVQKILGKLDHTNRIEIRETSCAKAANKITPSPKPSLPIIFIHQSNSEHLKYSLAQARQSNSNSSIFLLGDSSNNAYEFVQHQFIADYFSGAAQFKNIYKHYSTNGFDFELICFQRWFILQEFLKTHGIGQCLYLDSDIMLYADVTKEQKKFEQFDFTLCWNTIGCVFFLNRLQGLDEYCQFLMDIYTQKDKYHYDKMLAHYAVRRKNRLAGGVCDMTAFDLFSEVNFGQVGEASHIIDGSVYDPNINMPNPGFEMENGIKKITWKDDYPWGTHIRTGETIRFNSLHFNGRVKKLMSQFYTGDRISTSSAKLEL